MMSRHYDNRLLVVSIHDVAPSTESSVRALLGALDSMGVERRSLLVVPNEGGVPLTRSPSLVALLQREAERGNEMVVHGYTHRCVGPMRGTLGARARGRLFAPGQAEFLGLTAAEAGRCAAAGRAMLAEAALHSDAFCAPAWLEQPDLGSILAGAGYRLSIRMGSVLDLHSGRRLNLAWSGYMGAGRLQEVGVSIGGLGRRLLPGSNRLQVFLHPQGAAENGACARALELIHRLTATRSAIRYADLLS